MLSNFCPTSTDHKQLQIKKNVEIDSCVAIGGLGKDMKYISFPWPPLATALSSVLT
jgi:hypothetical protein